jgi:AP-1 complex subunit sigma 1/2
MSRQGKVRLAKWYSTYSQRDRAVVLREVAPAVLGRPPKLCNFVDWRGLRLCYRRYASLFFVCAVDPSGDNELLALETVHLYVEALDRYFGNVCELDLVFNFHKAHYVLDELLLGGEPCEPSRRAAARAIEAQDQLVEQAKLGNGGGGGERGEAAAATGSGAGVGYRPSGMGYEV